MRVGEIVKSIFRERGKSYRIVAERLDYKHASAISNRLDDTRPITTDILIKILDELDCDLIIRSRTKDKKEWVIDELSKEE
jgi:plasmid maintenance system antidote protein VapI